MHTLKVSTRLALMIGVMSLMLIVTAVVGLYGIAAANDALKTVYQDRTVPAIEIGEIRYRQEHTRSALGFAVADPTPAQVAASLAAVEQDVAQVAQLWKSYQANRLTPDERRLADVYAEHRRQYRDEGLAPAMNALRANDRAEAARIVLTVLPRLFAPLLSDAEALLKLQVDVAKSEYEQANARYESIRALTAGTTLFGLAFSALLGYFLTTGLVRSLGAEPGEVKQAAQAVAAGDLCFRIDLRPGDRASVMAAMHEMSDSLHNTVQAVRRNAENVAAASAQIASGNVDLSSRTEEQASALEQTAASMEQLDSTVKLNAENAREANQLAASASTVATRGGEVVGRVVETMKGINDSSKKIADIISVIDGIAFQTNILALNAAVEAARAGEQGRGFAVVASEVRSLAQRSAQAAREITALITASVERVAQGSTLVDQAGATMQEIVHSIQRVADIMNEITTASSEQNSGVHQIGEAVAQMDRTTQQNAALVEESAAAADNLKHQAEELVQAVSVFKIA